MKKIKVGILGVGAIGSVIITGLFRNKILELHYFNRSKKEMTMVQFFDTFYSIPLNIQQDIFIPIKLDWLIICLKEHHFAEATNFFQKLISRKTKVAIIRNGIELKKPLLPFAKENQVLECMINCPTQPDENQIYQQMGLPIITTARGDLANDFQHLFKNKDFKFRQVEDFKTETWKKLLESSCLGALTCLTGETCWIFEDEKIRTLYSNLLREGIEVAKADGAIISSNFVNTMLEKLKTYPKRKGSSMLTDRKLGRPIELGAKNGAIVNLGKKYNIDTPLHELVVTILEKTNVKNINILKKQKMNSNIQEVKTKAIEIFRNNELNEAIDYLLENLDNNDEWKNQLILLSARNKRLEQNRISKTISKKKYQLAKNRIYSTFPEIVNSLEESFLDIKTYSSQSLFANSSYSYQYNSREIQLSIIIILLILILIGVFFIIFTII